MKFKVLKESKKEKESKNDLSVKIETKDTSNEDVNVAVENDRKAFKKRYDDAIKETTPTDLPKEPVEPKQYKVDKKTYQVVVESYDCVKKDDKDNFIVSCKDRAQLAKLIENLKKNNIKHRISKSMNEGYRYDVSFKNKLLKEEIKRVPTVHDIKFNDDKSKIIIDGNEYEFLDSNDTYYLFKDENGTQQEIRRDGKFETDEDNDWVFDESLKEDLTDEQVKNILDKYKDVQLDKGKLTVDKFNGKPLIGIYDVISDKGNANRNVAILKDQKEFNDFVNACNKNGMNLVDVTSLEESLKEYYSEDREKTIERDGEADDYYLVLEGRRDGYGINQVEDGTMTVGEFIDYLSQFDENAKIIIGNDYQRGGYWYTYGYINEDSITEIYVKDAPEEEDDDDLEEESLKESKKSSLKESEDKDWDLEGFADDEVCIYQFAQSDKEWLKDAKKYNIEVLGIVGEDGFQPGDYVIKGTKKDLLDFCDGALHPDYLYHENEFDTDVIVEDDEFFDMGTALKNAFRKIKGVEIVDESKLTEDDKKLPKRKRQPKTRYVGNGEEEIAFFNKTNKAYAAPTEGEGGESCNEGFKDEMAQIKKDRPNFCQCFEFENGEFLYVDYDEDTNELYAGHLDNGGVSKEYVIEYDQDLDLQPNLEELYSSIIEKHPEFLDSEVTESFDDDIEDIEEISMDDVEIVDDGTGSIFDEMGEDEDNIYIDEEGNSIDVLKDKLDVKVDKNKVTIAEKGKIDDEDGDKVTIKVDEEEAETIKDDFVQEDEKDEEDEKTSDLAKIDDDEDYVDDGEKVTVADLKSVEYVESIKEQEKRMEESQSNVEDNNTTQQTPLNEEKIVEQKLREANNLEDEVVTVDAEDDDASGFGSLM